MPATPYPQLFTPIKVKSLKLKNRITMAPLYLGYAGTDGKVTAAILAHYRLMAKSGAALVVVENASITPAGAGASRVLRCDHERFVAGLAELAAAIKGQKCKAALQLNHAGRFAAGAETVSASDVAAFGKTPKALDKKEIAAIRRQFAAAAARVQKAGFDLTELHGGTGYLLAQFVSPRTNKRTDEYGGSIENRIRFPLEVLAAVKDKVGDFPVGYRLLADEWLADGLKPAEAKVLAAALDKAGVAYLSVMGGTYESFFLPEVVKKSKRPGYMVALAKTIKSAVTVPVIAAGRIATPDKAEAVLAEGKADLIGLARVLWTDPQWPSKARKGQQEAINPCRPACNACMQLVMKGKPALCPHWDKATREAYRQMLGQD